MAKSYLYLKELREYRTAINNFDAVLSNFPQSPFRAESLYLKSLCHLSLGEEQEALDSLRRLRESDPKSRFSVEALYQLADRYAERGDYQSALTYYQRYREEHPKHDQRSEVALRHATVLSELDRPEEAVLLLESLRPKDMSESTAFRGRLLLAKTLKELDRAEEAAGIVEELRDQAAFLKREDELRQLEGEIQLQRGLEEEGVATLDALATEFKGKASEGRARHALARYFLERYGPDDERVEEQLAAAAQNRTSDESVTNSIRLKSQMQKYRELRDRLALSEAGTDSSIAVADTTATEGERGAPLQPGNPALLSFELAELMLAELSRPEDALRYYRKALTLSPDSTAIAPRAAYAIGFILESDLDRPEEAGRAYEFLRERFPSSPQARALEGEEFLTVVARAKARSGDYAGGGPSAGTSTPGDFTGAAANHPLRSLRLGGPGATYSRRP
jgi:tetratricopeptide (TPR) repeat protein